MNKSEQQSKVSDFRIYLPYIKGDKLSEKLDKYNIKKQLSIMKNVGISISKIHDSNIIHGDLTTSNMIFTKDPTPPPNHINHKTKSSSLIVNNQSTSKSNNNFQIFFIDFGLGFISKKIEDKAVDLHLLKQALEAKHFKNWKKLWKSLKSGYKSSKNHKVVFEKLKAVEKRGRYKKQK